MHTRCCAYRRVMPGGEQRVYLSEAEAAMLSAHPAFRGAADDSAAPRDLQVQDMDYSAEASGLVVSGRVRASQRALYALVADESDARAGDYWTKTYVGKVAADGAFRVGRRLWRTFQGADHFADLNPGRRPRAQPRAEFFRPFRPVVGPNNSHRRKKNGQTPRLRPREAPAHARTTRRPMGSRSIDASIQRRGAQLRSGRTGPSALRENIAPNFALMISPSLRSNLLQQPLHQFAHRHLLRSRVEVGQNPMAQHLSRHRPDALVIGAKPARHGRPGFGPED